MTSLGSFEAASAALNKTWKKTTIEYDVLGEIHAGAVKSLEKGQAKLLAAAQMDPKGLADNRHSAHLIESIMYNLDKEWVKFNPIPDDAERNYWKILTDAEKRLLTVEADYGKNEAFRLNNAVDLITNRQLYTLFMINKPVAELHLQDASKVAAVLKGKREALGKELGADPINQYYPDVLKSFDF